MADFFYICRGQKTSNMATIKRYISPKVDKRGMSEIFFRISLTKNVKYRVKSGIYINATRFKDGEIIKPRANQK